MRNTLIQARALLQSADGVLITAGAGMGVDSGLPDFRGNEGMWEHYPALGRRSMGFSDIANPAEKRQDWRLAWGFYGHRLGLYRSTVPHPGFSLLRQFGESLPQGYFVFTSNVDGQFQKAGFDPLRMSECHGSIHYLQCLEPCQFSVWENGLPVVVDEAECRWQGALPVCSNCGQMARPNILMFGDWNWIETPYDRQRERLESWLQSVENPVVIEVGAGVAIPTVRRFGEQFADRLIRINPTQPEIRGGRGVSLRMGGLAGIRALLSSGPAPEHPQSVL
jgi:NAD-dependent SIR2 family protein deacetylase